MVNLIYKKLFNFQECPSVAIKDRFQSMNVPQNKIQKNGTKKYTQRGKKRKAYENREDVKRDRKRQRHAKQNINNSYGEKAYKSGEYTV